MAKLRGVQNDPQGIEMIEHLFYLQYRVYFQNQFQSVQQFVIYYSYWSLIEMYNFLKPHLITKKHKQIT